MRGGVLLILAVVAAAQDRTITSESAVMAVAFSKDGGSLSGYCQDSKLRQWDLRSGSLLKTISSEKDEMPAGAGSGLIAMAGKNGGIVLREMETGAAHQRIETGNRRVSSVAISKDRQAVAGSSRVMGNSREEVMRLWDGTGKERFAVPAGIETSVIAISPDGAILAAASGDTNVRAWNTRNGELLRLIEDELLVSMFDMAFTPDGKNLVAGGADRTVYFWDTKTWKLARKFTGQPEMITSLAFSPDGKLLASGGFNDIAEKHPTSVLLWDVGSGKVMQTFASPRIVSSVAFSPDGRLLAAASGDKTVRLWTVR